jgi:hypothetical protein
VRFFVFFVFFFFSLTFLFLLFPSRSSVRWWLTLFHYIIDCMIVNAWLLFIHRSGLKPHSLKQYDFRRQLAKQLIGDFSSRKRAGRPSQQPPAAAPVAFPRRFDPSLWHFLERMEERSARRCANPSCEHARSRPTLRCTVCDVPLHVECMAAYHGQ